MIAIKRQPQPQPLDRRQRQREIRQTLVDAGLVRAPLRVFNKVDSEVPIDRAELLATALQELGPIFIAFGRYLATRADLLYLNDCATLAAIPENAPGLPLQEFCNLETYALLNGGGDFHETPSTHRLFSQWHAGILHDGREVDVKVVRGMSDSERLDFDLLAQLQHAVEPLLTNPALFASVVADVRAWAVAETEPRRLTEALQTLQYDARQLELLRAPVVVLELCNDQCTIIERIPGQRLSDILAGLHRTVSADDSPKAREKATDLPIGLIPSELGRTISEVWLRQAFRGSLMPTSFCPENIIVVSNTEMAIADGQFTVLPTDAKSTLSNYLIATASSEVETGVRHLLSEFDLSHRTASDSELSRHFRQAVVPPSEGTHGGQRIHNELATHWRIATEHGLRPLNHMTTAVRALTSLSETTTALAPERDSLLDGIKNLRTSQLAHEVTNLLDPARWGSDFDRIAEILMFGPQRLDGALTSAADSRAATTTNSEGNSGSERRSQSPWFAMAVLGIAFLFVTGVEPKHIFESASAREVAVGVFLVFAVFWLRETKFRRRK